MNELWVRHSELGVTGQGSWGKGGGNVQKDSILFLGSGYVFGG